MKYKYNWAELKKEFFDGEFLSVCEFLRYKNIKRTSTIMKNMKGWGDEKRKYKMNSVQKTLEKTAEKQAERDAERAVSANELAYTLLQKLNNAVNELNINDGDKTLRQKKLEYDKQGKVIKETIVSERKNNINNLANAINTLNTILMSGTEKQEDKLDKYFSELEDVFTDDK